MTSSTSYRSQALALYESLRPTPLFKQMEETVEDSPWHREANVLVHTDMVFAEYVRTTDDSVGADHWTHADYLGAIECMWHDAGKPGAQIEKFSATRGKYRAYHGHEQVSSRLFETWAKENSQLSAADIVTVGWMIQNHMPWAQRDERKLTMLIQTIRALGGQQMYAAYVRSLLADQYGRKADDQETKNREAEKWVDELDDIAASTPMYTIPESGERGPLLLVPIAASGSGKSTLFDTLTKEFPSPDFERFSLDILRHQIYNTTDYVEAFRLSTEDNTFERQADAIFHQMLKCKSNIYLDNTNTSRKRRNKYITAAKAKGYVVIAILFPISLNEIIARQATRPDKCVPAAAVRQQYENLVLPMIGEVDAIGVYQPTQSND